MDALKHSEYAVQLILPSKLGVYAISEFMREITPRKGFPTDSCASA